MALSVECHQKADDFDAAKFWKFQNEMQNLSSRGEPVSRIWPAPHSKPDWGLPLLTSFRRKMNEARKKLVFYLLFQYLQGTLFPLYRKYIVLLTAESNSDWCH